MSQGSPIHLSFKGDQAGLWTPRLPCGSELPSKNVGISEPNTPRISFAPTLLGCFQAIYPNVSNYFEEENYPHLDCYIYRPQFTGKERLRWHEDLTKDKWVWDAHITKELVSLDPVKMMLEGKVRIFNCADKPGIETHPFNDPTFPTRMVYPTDLEFKLLKSRSNRKMWLTW